MTTTREIGEAAFWHWPASTGHAFSVTKPNRDDAEPLIPASDLEQVIRAVRIALANVYVALDCVSSPKGGEVQTRLENAVSILEAIRDGKALSTMENRDV